MSYCCPFRTQDFLEIVSRKHGLKISNSVSALKLLGSVASEARAARCHYERWSISQPKWSIGASEYLLCLSLVSPSITPLPDPQSSPSISASREDPCGWIPQDRLSPHLGIKNPSSNHRHLAYPNRWGLGSVDVSARCPFVILQKDCPDGTCCLCGAISA